MSAIAARTDSLDQRTAILSRLLLRNRLVGILRFGVPAIGLIAFVALAAQIYIGNLLESYGVSGVRIDRNNLVVETPSYTSAGPDGTLYTMAARSARSSFDQPDRLVLTGLSLDVTPPSGTAWHADAAEASMSTTDQSLALPGTTLITGDDGMKGSIADLVADLARRNVSGGATRIDFPDGSGFSARSASFDSRAGTWIFSGVTMRLPDTPQAVTP
ncbi:MAG: hypothetical protein ABL879_01485 [Devosia sp.]